MASFYIYIFGERENNIFITLNTKMLLPKIEQR